MLLTSYCSEAEGMHTLLALVLRYITLKITI